MFPFFSASHILPKSTHAFISADVKLPKQINRALKILISSFLFYF